MAVVVSGIRPTGNLHLGNYFGALRHFINLQEQNECFFFIADYHALTTHTCDLQLHCRNVLAQYLAAGLDPAKCTLYKQSHVTEVSELYLLLSMHAYVGELQRCTSFKDKIRKQPENVNAGLLTYPILMAADILLHKGSLVPVGKDQEPHLELTRAFAERFNSFYKVDFFPLTQSLNLERPETKIFSLSGQGKMGKSEDSRYTIFLTDSAESIRKKIQGAPTDAGPQTPNAPKEGGVGALFQLLYLLAPDEYKTLEFAYNNCSIKYKDLKAAVSEAIISFVVPFQQKIEAHLSNPSCLDEVLEEGAAKARAHAKETMKDIRGIMHL